MKIITENCKNIESLVRIKGLSCNLGKNLEILQETKNVVILGNFDGVHRGHREIFEKAKESAKEKGYKTVVYTFREYPQKKATRITTPSEKLYLIDECGIDYIYLDEFENVKDLTPEEFVEEILVKKLNIKEIYCGFNFTFGKGKSGNIQTLDKILETKYNKEIVLKVQSPVVDSDKEVVSSTRIREYIKNTNFIKMKELLGHNFILLGEVVHGKKLGRTLGFPTANFKFRKKVYPNFGVYGAYIQIEGEDKIYHGVMNIGRNPTVESGTLNIETHIFDFNKDIYGKVILVEILEKISDEVKLNSIDELIEKIDNDARIWRKRIDEKYGDTSKNR